MCQQDAIWPAPRKMILHLNIFILQYTARFNAETVKNFLYTLNDGKISKKKFNCKFICLQFLYDKKTPIKFRDISLKFLLDYYSHSEMCYLFLKDQHTHDCNESIAHIFDSQ